MAGSVVRRVDLDRPWELAVLPRDAWDGGDVVAVEVVEQPRRTREVELVNGRMAGLGLGDRIVGALGNRHATLEAVGSWRDVEEDGRIDLMTSAGLLGRVTSLSMVIDRPVRTTYVGHVVRDGVPLRLEDTVPEHPGTPLTAPVVLLIGTSMSAGKTTSAKVVIHLLKERGHRVVGTKLTGAGRFRDVLAMRDAGADAILDFVDVGLPSTVVDPALFERRLDLLLALIAAERPDVVVAEAGASPLEPYNGDVAMHALGELVACTVLSAFDPYAVAGVIHGFGRRADLVTGPAAATSAAVELVDRLTGLPALNVLDPSSLPRIGEILDLCGLGAPGARTVGAR